MFTWLEHAGWQYSIGIRMQKGIREEVQAIEESAWQPTENDPEEGEVRPPTAGAG